MVVHVKVPAMICFFVKLQNNLVWMLAVHGNVNQPTAFVALSFFNAFFACCVPRHTFLLSIEENMKENGKTKKKRNEWIECKNALALLVMLMSCLIFFWGRRGGLKFDFAFEPHPTIAPPLSPTQFSSCRHATKNGCILETSIFGSSPFLFAHSWPTENTGCFAAHCFIDLILCVNIP